MCKREMTLKERKNAMKTEWEGIFGKKIEDCLTDEGLKRFWSNETSLACTEHMLTMAAFLDVLDSNDGLGIVISVGHKENEPKACEGCEKKESKFAVLEKKDNHLYPDRFETEEEAYNFIKDICMNTPHTFDDFNVFEER